MADYRVSGEQLKSIADAIRQTGSTNQPLRFPDGFTAAIGSLATLLYYFSLASRRN